MAAPPLKKLKKGELLFNDGDKSSAMYFINKGTIRLFKKKGAGSIEIGMVHQGEVIGEMGFLDGGPRSAAAEALYDSELTEINNTNMAEQMKSLPAWLMVLLKTVVNRLRSANNKIRQLESSSVALSYGNDGPEKQYEFLNGHDVLKIMTAVLVCGARSGAGSTGAAKCSLHKINKYANQVMGIHLSKISEMVDLLERVGLVKVDRAVLDKIEVYVLDMNQIEILINFMCEENTKDNTKKIKFSVKGIVIMGYIVKYLSQFPPNAEGVCEVNIAKIISSEKTANGGKEPFRLDEFGELVRMKFAAEPALKDSDTILSKMNGQEIVRMFKIQKAIKEIDNVNEKKRTVTSQKAGGAAAK